MPDEPRGIYWDSCVFIHYIEGTKEWMSILDALLDEASQGNRLVILTSTVSITEVAYAKSEKPGNVLDPNIEAAIDNLWNDLSAVQLVELSQIIARDARSLVRQSVEIARSLKPLDAIHLATARIMNVSDFHTMDGSLKQWNNLGFPVRDPWTAQPKLDI